MGNLCGKDIHPNKPAEDVKLPGTDDGEEAGAEEEIIGELPMLRKDNEPDSREIGTRNSRVTLMARPQCIPIAAEEDEKIVTIVYISMNINVDKNKCQSMQNKLSSLCQDSNRICLYAGPIDETLKNAKIDAAITKSQTDANPDCFVLSTTKACHLSLERLGQRIGVIGLNDCDNGDQWLVTAKQEASKLKKSDGLHMLIAMVGGDLDQAVKLAKICVDGVKVIFCHDEVKPSGEQIQYGTTIINLNPNDKKLVSFATTFDQFNQPECKPARFVEI